MRVQSVFSPNGSASNLSAPPASDTGESCWSSWALYECLGEFMFRFRPRAGSPGAEGRFKGSWDSKNPENRNASRWLRLWKD